MTRREPWDDWVMTYGEPSVWCGFDWPKIITHYVVLPQPTRRELDIENEEDMSSEKDWQPSEADRDNRFYRNKKDTEYLDGLRAEVERLRGIERFATEASRHERDGLRAEIERLKEQLASLQASSGYEVSIAQAEIERLREALQEITQIEKGYEAVELARAALEPKP